MRIVHLSTSDIGGGAARAAFRVHTGLSRLGNDSKMLVQRRWSVDPNVIKFTPSDALIDRIRRRFRGKKIRAAFDPYKPTRPQHAEPFADDRTEWAGDPLDQLPECDLVNLHWVAGFVDHLPFFEEFARRKIPVVWRLADMAPVTGGCHYDQHCGRFTAQCGACPMLGSKDEHDLSRDIWTRKNEALSLIPTDRMHIVGPSRWIAAQAAKSSLLGRFKQSVIPNALDPTVFRPMDKQFSRDVLNLPRDARVVLFAADSAKHPRKGFGLLAQAVEGITEFDNLVLASVGGGKPEVSGTKPLVNIGKVDDDRVLAMAYSAADVYVIPSLQESFGQTVIESMACGTPVVGFAAGGITDTVRPGESGLLAKVGDVAELRAAIVELLKDDAGRARIATRAREIVMAEYTLDVQAKQYEALYRTLLGP